MEHHRDRRRKCFGHRSDMIRGLWSGLSARLNVLKPESALVGDLAIANDRDAQTRVSGDGHLFLQPRIHARHVVILESADVLESRRKQWRLCPGILEGVPGP